MYNKIKKQSLSNSAFMGPTHALSVVAVFLLIAAFFPVLFSSFFQPESLALYLTALIIAIGAGLLPDFDNVKSTAISVMGPIGSILSTLMRSIARIIYSITRSKYDKPDADPHRGFWHTIIAGLLVGFLSYLLITATNVFSFNLFGKNITGSIFIVGIFLLIATQLMFSAFFKSTVKRISNGLFGGLVIWALGLGLTISLLSFIPSNADFKWVGFAISAGWIIHILGDTLTTSGTPLLWPIPRKGHRWWSWRMYPRIRANGPVEHYVFVPLFLILILISLIKLFFL